MEVELNPAPVNITSSEDVSIEVSTKKTKYFSLSLHSSLAPIDSYVVLMPVCLTLT
jgi:hypothetical protein